MPLRVLRGVLRGVLRSLSRSVPRSLSRSLLHSVMRYMVRRRPLLPCEELANGLGQRTAPHIYIARSIQPSVQVDSAQHLRQHNGLASENAGSVNSWSLHCTMYRAVRSTRFGMGCRPLTAQSCKGILSQA